MSLPALRSGQQWVRRDGYTVLIEHVDDSSGNFYAQGAYYHPFQVGNHYCSTSGIRDLDLVGRVTTSGLAAVPLPEPSPAPLKRTFESIVSARNGREELAVGSDGTAWKRSVDDPIPGPWHQIPDLPQP
jgi:hypothetical protein